MQDVRYSQFSARNGCLTDSADRQAGSIDRSERSVGDLLTSQISCADTLDRGDSTRLTVYFGRLLRNHSLMGSVGLKMCIERVEYRRVINSVVIGLG